MRDFKDWEHLARLIGLLLAALVVFFVASRFMVPKGFGEYGHYRAGALELNSSKAVVHAGRDACAECHGDVLEARKGSKHTRIGCETCHGPAAAHAADPDKTKPVKPNGRALCLNCHAENVARPAKFAQVDPKDHGDSGPCTTCHPHHHPEPEAAK